MQNKIISIFAKPVYLLFIFIFFIETSCKKLIEVDGAITSINSDLVYATDANATAVLTGIYIGLSQSGIRNASNLTSVSLFAGLSADELDLYSLVTDQAYIAHYQNNLSNSINGLPDYWSNTYNVIFTANAAIEGINSSFGLTPWIKQQLLGEAYFIRAFCYFYLVNLYGDVPLNLSTDYKESSINTRAEKSKVYQQIIRDLKEAKSLLSPEYKTSGMTNAIDRVRPNLFAAEALLARAYLFAGDYENAELEATNVINNKTLYDTVELNNVFLKNSKETIWAIQPTNNTGATNTTEADLFIIPATGPTAGVWAKGEYPVFLSAYLTNKFTTIDKRRGAWIDSVVVNGNIYRFVKKYKNDVWDSEVTEHPVVIRLAEVYLIRAEARARGGKLADARMDLNVIRSRAGLPDVLSNSEPELTDAILNERQMELFTEWGHRWLDLKRTGTADAVLSEVKGANWQASDQLYLIPQIEIDRNPNVKQNP